MREFRTELNNLGYNVQAGWLDEESEKEVDPVQASERDLRDTFLSEIFILVNPPPFVGGRRELARGGRVYEAGYADAIGMCEFFKSVPIKRLIAIGDNNCLHLQQPIWEKYNTKEEFLNAERRSKGH